MDSYADPYVMQQQILDLRCRVKQLEALLLKVVGEVVHGAPIDARHHVEIRQLAAQVGAKGVE